MADVYLYPGESNPNDVRLRVFASIFLAIVGVAASPVIGEGSITATVPTTGVSASPAVGSFTYNAQTPLTGVLGSAAIGVGQFNADFAISGVVAGAAVGVTQINVSTAVIGVAATPAIGTGTVETGSDVEVDLTGVAAAPAIGTGTVQTSGRKNIGIGEPWRPRRPYWINVRSEGVAALPRCGRGTVKLAIRTSKRAPVHVATKVPSKFTVIDARSLIDIEVRGRPSPLAVIGIGKGTIKTGVDLFPEEIAALMEFL